MFTDIEDTRINPPGNLIPAWADDEAADITAEVEKVLEAHGVPAPFVTSISDTLMDRLPRILYEQERMR
jgi:hypothetical protein